MNVQVEEAHRPTWVADVIETTNDGGLEQQRFMMRPWKSQESARMVQDFARNVQYFSDENNAFAIGPNDMINIGSNTFNL